MIKDVVESGMTFPVEGDNTFFIEKSNWINNTRNIKSVEFVELMQKFKSLRFVEAKMSNPNAINKDDFEKYICEIRDKFQNSISLMFSALSNRQGLDKVRDEFPNNMKSVDYKNVECGLWLVVKTSKPEWLIPVMDSLKKELKPILAIWNIPDSNLKVVNEEDARRLTLIK